MPSPTWRDRRKRRRIGMYTAATLKPVAEHAFDLAAFEDVPFATKPVVVRNVSLDGVGLRARLPLNICSVYTITHDDPNIFLRSTRVRIVSCRRADDGMYEIGAAMCHS